MMEENVLSRVKETLGIMDEFQDKKLLEYIYEVKQYLLDGGVAENVVESEDTIGVISRGVIDLWNYGSGEANLSSYFMQRAAQLAYKDISRRE